jgi:hypothetical protein
MIQLVVSVQRSDYDLEKNKARLPDDAKWQQLAALMPLYIEHIISKAGSKSCPL